jgi:hypothetical protein
MGGVSADMGHFLNIITKGKVDWNYFHNLGGFFFGLLVASCAGFLAIILWQELDLRGKNQKPP